MIAPYAALDAVLGPVAERLAQSRRLIQPTELPPLLFHYTNARGLLGILDTARLWTSNYRFLNDSSEIKYGVALLESIIEEKASHAGSDVIDEFFRRTRVTANAFDGMFECYVTCFCERDDLLNQWRVYTGSGGGFALGLHAKQIGMRPTPNPGSQHDFSLRKVLYDESKQRELIAEVMDATVSVLRVAATDLSVEEANNLIARCCQFVRAESAEYFMCFKHPAFEVEQEWRLCHVVPQHEELNVSFREGPFGLTPYVALDPSPSAGVFSNKLPLGRVTHGPTPDAPNVRYALRKLLRTKGYAHTDVEGSVLPVRVGV